MNKQLKSLSVWKESFTKRVGHNPTFAEADGSEFVQSVATEGNNISNASMRVLEAKTMEKLLPDLLKAEGMDKQKIADVMAS